MTSEEKKAALSAILNMDILGIDGLLATLGVSIDDVAIAAPE